MSRPRTSRELFRDFVDAYAHRSVDDAGTFQGTDGARSANRWQLYRRRDYMRFLRPHRYAVGVFLVLALLVAAMEMAEPLFMRFIIDGVLLNNTLDGATRLTRLQIAGTVFVGVIAVSNGLCVLKDYRQRLLSVRVMMSIRHSLFDRLLRLPLAKLWEMKTGGILSRLTGDVEATAGLLQMAVLSPTIALIRLTMALTVLIALNWRLALTALAIIPGTVLITSSFSRRIRPIYRSARKDAGLVDGRVGETFAGIRVVRGFGRETRELITYMIGRHAVLRKELFAHRRELILSGSWGLLSAAVNVMIICYGGYLNTLGRASIGDILAFQWYTILLMGPVSTIVNSRSELQRSVAAMERVLEALAMATDKPDKPDARDAPLIVHEVRFENVQFEYVEGRAVVHDFNVVVPGGSVVALVGRSGAGKTTVTDLVARFQDPTRGRILLNGSDICDFRLASYRRLLAIVQQEVFLFDSTVRENITYGRQNATNAEVEDAARRANAHEFIVRLPEQYETFVGERGVKLSGGECQRLSIARAILASPQILILDEATSNLDTESEQLIEASIATLLAGRTTFVIAHRLSTIRRANLILLLDDGCVIERGTHDDLMAARGAYYSMVGRQMG